jgi:hypothetical protein
VIAQVNAVFYKDYDDQYRAHCDGEVRGSVNGKPIATAGCRKV